MWRTRPARILSDGVRFLSNTFDDWKGESLQHYGVLGMKWGQRRFQNPDGTLTPAGQKHYAETGERGYQYHSHATKKYNRKAEKQALKADKAMEKYGYSEKGQAKAHKAISKAEKFKNRANRSAELDRREQAAAEKAKTGRAILTRMLINPDVTKAYHQYNAMAGGNPGKATKIVNGIMASFGGSLTSRMYKAAYIRKGEKADEKGWSNRVTRNMEKQNEFLSKYDKAIDSEIKKKRRQYNI